MCPHCRMIECHRDAWDDLREELPPAVAEKLRDRLYELRAKKAAANIEISLHVHRGEICDIDWTPAATEKIRVKSA